VSEVCVLLTQQNEFVRRERRDSNVSTRVERILDGVKREVKEYEKKNWNCATSKIKYKK